MDINKLVHFLIIELPFALIFILSFFHFLGKRRERIAEERARAAAELEKENRARAAEEKRKAAEQARERAAAERREKEENRHAEKRRRAEELAELAERRLNAEREYVRLKTSTVKYLEPAAEPNRMFGWNYPVLDDGRVNRAKKVKIISLYSDAEGYHARCEGSEGKEYYTTLSSCECRDFFVHRQPCKHMIRLAMIAGILNDKGETPEQETARLVTEAKIKAALSRGFMEIYGIELMSASVLYEISSFSGSTAGLSSDASLVLDIPLDDFISSARGKIKPKTA